MKKYLLLLLISVMSMVGCTAEPKQEYRSYNPTAFHEERVIRWIPVPKDKIDKECKSSFQFLNIIYNGVPLRGCAFFPEENTCLILAPEPEANNDKYMLTLGHEVAHCFRGRFH